MLLHGQPGSADDWQWLIPFLEDGYTVVAPDRPGYGRTGGPAAGFAGNADAAVGLLDHLGLDRAVFVGHSWAGAVALAAAENHPDRVAGLVLVASVAPGLRPGWDDRLLAAPVLGDVITAGTMRGLGLVLRSARLHSLAERRLGERGNDAVAALTRLTRSGDNVWRAVVAEQRSLLTELPGLAAGLGGITAPTAVVQGRQDRVVPVKAAGELVAAIPGAVLRLVPGVGHMVPHDRPGAIAEAIDLVAGRRAG
jgi:pimeloyl-ACP methyl ester carboxylesterase